MEITQKRGPLLTIVEGPGEFDFISSQFRKKKITFSSLPQNTGARIKIHKKHTVIITATQREDGIHKKWIFQGDQITGSELKHVHGFYDLTSRKGFLQEVSNFKSHLSID